MSKGGLNGGIIKQTSSGGSGGGSPPTGTGLVHVTNGVQDAQAVVVTNVMLASMPAGTIKGNATGSTAAVADLTASQVKTMLAIVAADVSGLGGAALLNVGTSTGTVAAGDDARFSSGLQKSANLSDLGNAGTARGNLGLGSAALASTSAFDAAGAAAAVLATSLQAASNLADLGNAGTARGNLGLGSAATQSSSAFDASGAAAAVLATSLQKASNLSDLANAGTARGNLGLGSAATQASSAFDASGAAAAVLATSAQKASNLSDLASAATAFANISPLTTLGDLIYASSGGAPARLAGNATTGKLFLSQTGTGSASAAPAWAALGLGDIPNLPASIITTGQIGPAQGGTGQDCSAAANGVLLIGTGSGLAQATLTAGTNVTITNAAGSITISATGGGGSGTVTSVGLTMPGVFSVGSSPVTTSGTIAVTLATQSANTVWAGPTSGSAAAPAFRALVAADLPATAVTAAGYGAAGSVATFTVDAQGRLTAAATVAIAVTPSQVTGFDTQVRTSRLDQMAAPTASVSFNSQKGTNALDPTSAQDVATKNYVDTVAQGLDAKPSVLVATTANITLSGEQTIDGFLTSASRVLVKNQTTQSQNGIYVTGAGAWTRALDMDAGSEFSGAFVFVEEGTVNGNAGWVCTTVGTVVVGTSNITWTQFSGAGSYTAGTSLTLTGTVFSVTAGGIGPTQLANTAVTGGSYGSASSVATFTVDAQGRLTAAASTPIALAASAITSGQLAVARGGTGVDASAAANGALLIGNSTGFSLAAPTAGPGIALTLASGSLTVSAVGNYTTVSDAAYTVLGTDAIVAMTTLTAARIFTLPAASAVNPGRELLIIDDSGNASPTLTITINRAGSDTIEGGTAPWIIRGAKSWFRIVSDGVSNWRLIGMAVDIQIFLSAGSTNLVKVPGAREWDCELIGGGGGGMGGGKQPSGTASTGGSGGSGGGYTYRRGKCADLPGTVAVVVGAGGTSGAGATTNSTTGTIGGQGGTTSFAAGTAAVQTAAAGGISATTIGGQGTSPGGTGGSGGTGAGGNNAALAYGVGGGGGGGGGGIPVGATFSIGGHGEGGGLFSGTYGALGSAGNARGLSDGAAGGSPTSLTPANYAVSAPGGGGGASSVLGTGGAGGNGASPGGGGGGGGSSLTTGGAGGTGGVGMALVRQWF